MGGAVGFAVNLGWDARRLHFQLVRARASEALRFPGALLRLFEQMEANPTARHARAIDQETGANAEAGCRRLTARFHSFPLI